MHDGNIREAYVRVRRYPLHSAKPKIKLYYSYVRDEIPYLGAFSDDRKDSLGCTMTPQNPQGLQGTPPSIP